VRWQFKLEPTEVLEVTVSVVDSGAQETFFARMLKDGRIVVPKLTLALLKGDEPVLKDALWKLHWNLHGAESSV
jgi:hypothetical protein